MRGHRGRHGVEAKAIAAAARPTRREEALEVFGGHALAVVLDVDRDLIREALHGEPQRAGARLASILQQVVERALQQTAVTLDHGIGAAANHLRVVARGHTVEQAVDRDHARLRRARAGHAQPTVDEIRHAIEIAQNPIENGTARIITIDHLARQHGPGHRRGQRVAQFVPEHAWQTFGSDEAHTITFDRIGRLPSS